MNKTTDNNAAFIQRLLNKRLVSAAAKNLSLEQMDKVIAVLQNLRQQKETEIAEAKRQQEEEQRKLQEVYDYALNQGVSPEQMLQFFKEHTVTSAPAEKLPPKYRFIDQRGTVYEWCGRGAAPAWYKALQDSNQNTNDYLIGADGLTNQQRQSQQG